MRRVVVFPQPEGPSITKNEPSGIVKVEFFTATKSPNVFLSFSTRISAMAHSRNFDTIMNIAVPARVVTKE
jgi:hypothetical protein